MNPSTARPQETDRKMNKIFVLLALLRAMTCQAFAGWVGDGNELYKQGNYEGAIVD